MITEKQLKEWEQLANAATPGPWKTEGYSQVSEDEYQASVRSEFGSIAWCSTLGECYNPEFIAAARTAVPALITEVKELQNKLDTYLKPLCEHEIHVIFHPLTLCEPALRDQLKGQEAIVDILQQQLSLEQEEIKDAREALDKWGAPTNGDDGVGKRFTLSLAQRVSSLMANKDRETGEYADAVAKRSLEISENIAKKDREIETLQRNEVGIRLLQDEIVKLTTTLDRTEHALRRIKSGVKWEQNHEWFDDILAQATTTLEEECDHKHWSEPQNGYQECSLCNTLRLAKKEFV